MPTENKLIRVLLVDDHAAFRKGLAAFLEIFDDLELAGEAANGAEALQLCGQLEPEVVLMDVVMPVMDGVEAARLIRERYPHIRVVALTSFKERQQVQDIMQAGAMGYLLKDISAIELARAIRQAVAGQTTLALEATQALVEAQVQAPRAAYDLTDRELEVLALLAEGLNNRQIAQKLYLSHNTIKSHISNILMKMGASGRVEAVAQALKRGLLPSNAGPTG